MEDDILAPQGTTGELGEDPAVIGGDSRPKRLRQAGYLDRHAIFRGVGMAETLGSPLAHGVTGTGVGDGQIALPVLGERMAVVSHFAIHLQGGDVDQGAQAGLVGIAQYGIGAPHACQKRVHWMGNKVAGSRGTGEMEQSVHRNWGLERLLGREVIYIIRYILGLRAKYLA